jgi:hypothetical protein
MQAIESSFNKDPYAMDKKKEVDKDEEIMSTHHEHEELELIVISDEEQEYHSGNVEQGDNADDDDDGDDGDDGDDDGDEAMLPRDSESESDDDGKYRNFMHMEDLIPVDEDERNLYYASLESLDSLKYPEATPGAIQQRKDDVVFTIDMLMGVAQSKKQAINDQINRDSGRARTCMCDTPGKGCKEVIVVSDDE